MTGSSFPTSPVFTNCFLVPWLLLALVAHVFALGQDTCVKFQSSGSTFTVVNSGKAAPILISSDDWPGVQRAAFDFASDIESVTGVKPTLKNVTSSQAYNLGNTTAIIVGTLGKSPLIDEVVNRTKLDLSSIQGKWESFLAKEVKNPLPGISSAYVVIGADKRGSIYALYDHSEQFGACMRCRSWRRKCSRSITARQVYPLGTGATSTTVSIECAGSDYRTGGRTYRRRSIMRCSSTRRGARTALRRSSTGASS